MPSQHEEVLAKIVAEEMGRAGMTGLEPSEVAKGVLSGSPQHTALMQLLMDTGNPDLSITEVQQKYPDITDNPDTPDVDEGLPALRAKQWEGFEGRGWTQKELDELNAKGVYHHHRLLSRGGKQAYDWSVNRDFLNTLIDSQKPPEPGKPPKYPAPWTGTTADQHLAGAAQQWNERRASKHAHMDNDRMMQSDENPFGWLINNLFDPVTEAIDYGAWNGHSNYATDANKHRQLKNWANDYDPVLPGNPQTPEEKEAKLKELRQALTDAAPAPADRSAYDQSYRRENGQYPSYGGSTLMWLGQNLLDFTTPFTGLGVGKNVAKALSKNAAKAYAEAAAKAAAKGLRAPVTPASKAIGHVAGEAASETVPMVALGGATVGAAEVKGGSGVPWGWNLFTPGHRPELPDQTQEQWEQERQALARKRVVALHELDNLQKSAPAVKHDDMGNLPVTGW
jgi:hypothetical protein